MPDHTFTVTVTEAQQRCIADSVLDWKEWFERAAQYAVDHKADLCLKRLIARDEHLLTGDTIPREPTDRANAIMASPEYKDRAARDKAEGIPSR